MHYRRLFDFREVIKTGKCTMEDALGLKKKYLIKIFEDYDFIYKKGVKINSPYDFKCYQPEVKLSDSYHKILFDNYKIYNKEHILYGNSMFIMKRQDFFNYCEECAPVMLDVLSVPRKRRMEILFEFLEKNCTKEQCEKFENYCNKNAGYHPRHVAFIMEYISSFYFKNLMDRYNARALGCNILLTEPPKLILLYKHKVIRAIIKILVSKKKYKKLKNEPVLFFQDSKSPVIRYLGRFYN